MKITNTTAEDKAPLAVANGHAPEAVGQEVFAAATKPRSESIPAALASPTPNPPTGHTGGNSRHPNVIKGKFTRKGQADTVFVPQTAPPRQAIRKSRVKSTSQEMDQFLRLWFFDFLTVTIPNSENGKGTKKVGLAGDKEAIEAQKRLCLWSVLQGLERQRVGKGSDQYSASANYGRDPLSKYRLVSVRAGHPTNMPGLEIPGGNGACATLAIAALSQLGPVLMPRADVTLDISQPLLFENLLQYATNQSKKSKMAMPRLISSDTGETFYWGSGETSVKVYQKDKEQLGKGKISEADCDEHRTRIEFSFRPHKFGKKAGLANIARVQGAGALLGTAHWVRKMVQHIADITDSAQDCRLGVTRVEKTPDPKSALDTAMYGGRQYSKVFCEAVAASIVESEFEGDWKMAEIDPEQLECGAIDLFRNVLRETNAASKVASDRGLDALRNSEAEAERTHMDLLTWMIRQREQTEAAQAVLTRAGDEAARRPKKLHITFSNEGEMTILTHDEEWLSKSKAEVPL